MKKALSENGWSNILNENGLTEVALDKGNVITVAQKKVNKAEHRIEEIKGANGEVSSLVMKEKQKLQDKLFFEADLGFSKNNLDLLSVSPLLGYSLTDKVDFGLGSYWERASAEGFDFSGTRLLTRIHVLENIFAIQYENISSGFSTLSSGMGRNEGIQMLGARFSLPTANPNRLMNFTLSHKLNKPETISAYPSQFMSAWQMKMGMTF